MKSISEVMEFCRAEHESPSQDWEGYCLKFTRTAFGVGPLRLDAASAWAEADLRHNISSGVDVPRGAPVFWLGGSRGHGHVAVSAGAGLCWSTDWGGAGRVNLAQIDAITSQWNLDLVGWTEDINEVRVWQPKTARRTPRMDLLVEQARRARKTTNPSNAAKIQDLDKIIRLARRWSVAY